MTSSKRKEPKFKMGQIVAVKAIDGVCGWGKVTGIGKPGIQLDGISHVLYKHSELRPLNKQEQGR